MGASGINIWGAGLPGSRERDWNIGCRSWRERQNVMSPRLSL
jgi:hypothetical protein